MTSITTTRQRRAMTRLKIALYVIVGIALFVLGSAAVDAISGLTAEFGTPATCQEDEACWDCNTMGNGLCSADDATPFQP